MAALPGVSVVMAAHNEEAALEACLESVREWADEIIVVDSGSSDATSALAESYGATVVAETNKLMLNVNKNVAIDRARHEWVLLLDPDERVSPDLAEEIRRVATAQSDPAVAYWIPRRDRELGRELAHPSPQLRLFRNGTARFPCRHIHEMVAVDGPEGSLSGILVHEPRQSLFEYVHKRNLYSEHRAQFLYEHGERFRWWRLIVRPPAAFLKAYVVRRAWRDGVQGLIIAATGAFGTFLQDAKLWQLHDQRTAVQTHAVPAEPSTAQGD